MLNFCFFWKKIWKKNFEISFVKFKLLYLAHILSKFQLVQTTEPLSSLKKRGLAPTEQPEPDFSRAYGFRKVLGINKDCLEAKFFIDFVRAILEIWTKKHQKCTKKGFSPICDPPRFSF